MPACRRRINTWISSRTPYGRLAVIENHRGPGEWDSARAARASRKLKEILRADDTLVVWRLDRLGRSLKDLIAWVAWLEQEGIGLRSLHEALDTTTPSGKLTFHIFGALAEFERQLIQERTQAGLRVARARGRLGGRPKGAPGGQTAAGGAALPGEKDCGEADLCS